MISEYDLKMDSFDNEIERNFDEWNENSSGTEFRGLHHQKIIC